MSICFDHKCVNIHIMITIIIFIQIIWKTNKRWEMIISLALNACAYTGQINQYIFITGLFQKRKLFYCVFLRIILRKTIIVWEMIKKFGKDGSSESFGLWKRKWIFYLTQRHSLKNYKVQKLAIIWIYVTSSLQHRNFHNWFLLSLPLKH